MKQQKHEIREKKHNYFYRTTNQINWNFYFGIKSTDIEPENDKYLGSGTALEKAIKKYGRKNFHKTIIADYPTREEANEHERLVVTLDMTQNPMCYNIRTGGDNGFICPPLTQAQKDHLSFKNKGRKRSEEFRQLMREINSPENNKNIGSKRNDETKRKMSEWQKGKPKSEKTKLLLSESARQAERIKISIDNLRKATQKSKIPCIVNDIYYESMRDVCNAFNYSIDKVRYRLKSNLDIWSDWNYANKNTGDI